MEVLPTIPILGFGVPAVVCGLIWLICIIFFNKGWGLAYDIQTWTGVITLFASIITAMLVLWTADTRASCAYTYEGMQVEYTSIVNALDRTDDIVNTDLYMRAIEYNKKVAEYSVAQNHWNYKYNFDPDVDWSTLPLIIFE